MCYDILDRVTEKLYNDVVKVKFRYDKFGNLYEKQDLFTNTTYRYNYDLSGRITGVSGSDNTSLNYVYDEFNRIEKYITKFDDNSNITEYIYGDSDISGQKNGLIYGVKQNDTQRISYSYDSLARLSKKTINTTTPFEITYNYLAGTTNGTTSTVLRNMLVGYDYHNYFYDDVGNIVRYNVNGTNLGIYTYDALNQLKTETRANGDVYEYTYDNGGNIKSVTKNGTVIKSYGYQNSNWSDLLTVYNGDRITYDAIGNPLIYRDNMQFAWSNGRQLIGAYNLAYGTITYTYNADGLRTSKTARGLTTSYYWLDGVLLGETYGSNQIIYLYDENGTPYGFINNDTYYYYAQNAQGDVVGIFDADGNIVVKYEYSAWGEILSITGSLASTIGKRNPLRYRGYYYDSETGFYYLQSRYYDPVTCRFLNADGYVSTGQGILGNNMFAYCGNNPVNLVDPTGQFPITIVLFAVAATIAIVAKNQIIAKRNLKENSKVDNDSTTTTNNKTINDQNGKTGEIFTYGRYSASFNACETIAVHNAKVLKGIDSSLSQTMYDFQTSGAMFLYGVFGSNPHAIGSVLSKNNIEYSKVGLNEMTQSGTYIISFWNDNAPWGGLHTVAVFYDGVNYSTYNLYGDGKVYTYNPAEYASNYICGYFLG